MTDIQHLIDGVKFWSADKSVNGHFTAARFERDLYGTLLRADQPEVYEAIQEALYPGAAARLKDILQYGEAISRGEVR